MLLSGTKGTLIAEFTEIESGMKTNRPELEKAIRDTLHLL